MKRVWDEVGCEFFDFEPDWIGGEDDSCPTTVDLDCPAGLDIILGRFNGNRHVYLEVEGADEAIAAFEEAFAIVLEIYDVSLDEDAIAEIIPKCGADNLTYLRQRKLEYDEESEKAGEESDAKQQEEQTRWQNSEWHDLEKIAQAARDAGWQEITDNDYYGQNHKRFAFYHDIRRNADGNILRLELAIDDSRDIQEDLWLHESTSILYDENGSTGCFGGWNMSPSQQYVQNIDFVDRWLGIPTPLQAVAALKQVTTWNTYLEMCCAGFELG